MKEPPRDVHISIKFLVDLGAAILFTLCLMYAHNTNTKLDLIIKKLDNAEKYYSKP